MKGSVSRLCLFLTNDVDIIKFEVYNKSAKTQNENMCMGSHKRNPRRASSFWGFIWDFVWLLLVNPLADDVNNYACHDRSN